MGSMSVSSCRLCMFVSCVHHVAVLNAAFSITCSLLILVEDERATTWKRHTHSWYQDCLMVAMSVSFGFPHPVAVSV